MQRKRLTRFRLEKSGKKPTSWGVATFEYVFKFVNLTSAPKIVLEGGDVKARNLEPLYSTVLPPGDLPANLRIPPNADAIVRGILGNLFNRIPH